MLRNARIGPPSSATPTAENIMQDTATKARAKKPPLHITESDYDVIAELAHVIEKRSPALSKQLVDEIERAKLHPDGKLPANVVALGSEVEFVDDSNGTRRKVRLVMPSEADIEAGRISILTPVGAGLIGMSAGREIDWPCPDGRPRKLKILQVTQKP
jgi:regulator of nucleoside diphosphate kinase